jgi:hypothetical protein
MRGMKGRVETKPMMANLRDFAQHQWPVLGLLVAVMALAAYTAWPRTTASTAATAAPAAAPSWTRTCVAGVSYLQFATGTSVEWTPAGKVKTCSETVK